MNDRVANILSWVTVIAAAVAFVDPLLDYCNDLVFLGVSWIALGALFVVAYFCAEKSGVLHALMLLCQHATRPAGRGMAFFWFLFFVFLGGMSLAQGLGLADTGLSRGRLVFNSLNTHKMSCRVPSAR
jgi:hypothetical protein